MRVEAVAISLTHGWGNREKVSLVQTTSIDNDDVLIMENRWMNDCSSGMLR